jgi:hypothetical protein
MPARTNDDWSRVAAIEHGATIRVVVKSGQAVTRNFVIADESAMIALNLTEPRLPWPVRRTLLAWSSDRPHALLLASRGQALSDGRVRLGPDGVFLDGRKIAELDLVLEPFARDRIAEVSRFRPATGRGFAWGAVLGAGVGLGVTFAACGTNWNQETRSCSNLTAMWVILGPALGTLIGGAVGAGTAVPTVVYKAP